jgi:hypothetical protein
LQKEVDIVRAEETEEAISESLMARFAVTFIYKYLQEIRLFKSAVVT